MREVTNGGSKFATDAKAKLMPYNKKSFLTFLRLRKTRVLKFIILS
jgi:hypothetical protein